MCIIFCADLDGHRVLGKNRDRNYDPRIVFVQDRIGGVEVCYLYDEETGWIEGMNEYGIALVSSALMVDSDEKKGPPVQAKGRQKKPKTKRSVRQYDAGDGWDAEDVEVASDSGEDGENDVIRPWRDGSSFLSALSMTTVSEALGILLHQHVHGHTVVSDADEAFTIESTAGHGVVWGPLAALPYVQTNHGDFHASAGYADGANRASSVKRRDDTLRCMSAASTPADIFPCIVRESGKFTQMDMLRNTENMRTSSQMLLDCTEKRVWLYLMDNNVSSFKRRSIDNPRIMAEVIHVSVPARRHRSPSHKEGKRDGLPLGTGKPVREGLAIVERIDQLLEEF